MSFPRTLVPALDFDYKWKLILICKYLNNMCSVQGVYYIYQFAEWLSQQKFIFSVLQARSLRSRCQLGLFLMRVKKDRFVPGLSPWLWMVVFSLCLHVVFPLCVSVSKSPLLIRITVILNQGHSYDSFYLNYLFKEILSLNTVTFRGTRG